MASLFRNRLSLSIASLSIVTSSINFISNCESGDPLDCKRAVCADKLDMFKMSLKTLEAKKTSSTSSSTGSSSSSTTSSNMNIPVPPPSSPKQVNEAEEEEEDDEDDDCPPDRSVLGRGTWTLLHTMAAHYPDKPTKKQQEMMLNFIETLAEFYPCSICADDFQVAIKEYKPDVSSRESLSLWICNQHNLVNKKLYKPLYPCSLEYLDERWRYGKSTCWNYDDEDKQNLIKKK